MAWSNTTKYPGSWKGLTNAYCYAHEKRSLANAVKTIGKGNDKVAKLSATYQALARIVVIYKLEGSLKDLPAEEQLLDRQTSIKPLVDEYFTWVKQRLADKTCLPKGKTAEGLNYSVKQEEYLRLFLTNGDVPIDNSASECSIRPFTVSHKNWAFVYPVKGARASAVVYSITETAKLNDLNPYYYLKHLLEELPLRKEVDENIKPSDVEGQLTWSDSLPTECHKVHR